MKHQIKSGALALTLVLAGAACGGDDDTSDTTAESTDSTETTAAAAETTESTEAGTDTTDEAATEAATVVEIATGNEDFSILVAALQKAELVETLEGDGPFTVFAPTNAAFADALETLEITEAELLEREDLKDILSYHVLPAEVNSEAAIAADGTDQTTVQGNTVAVTVVDGAVKINEATVTTPDQEAANGVVHIIDQVLLPPTE